MVAAPGGDHRAVICCLATGRHRELMAESAPSMVAYARRHDWSVVLTSEPLNGERPPSWGKLQLIRELMSTYEYVFWVDADAIIVDLDRDLLAEIDTAVSDIWFARHPQDRDPGATELNAGVFAVHSTDWSRRLLTEVWNAEQFIDHNWWENAALLDLLGYSLDPPFAKVRESHWESRVGVLDLAWNSVPGYCESSTPAVNHHARSDHDNFQRRLDDMAADRRATQARFPAEFPAEFPAALGNPHPAPETHTRLERGADAGTAPSAVSRLAARGFRFLFLLDAAALFGIVVLVGIVRFGEPWADRSVANFTSRFAAATALQIVVCYFAGLYEREPRLGTRSWLPKAVLSMAIGVGAQAALIALDVYLMPRGNLLPWAVAGALALVVNRVVSRRLAARRHGPARVALVGADDAIELARTHLAAAHDTAVVACVLPSIDSLSEAVALHQVSDVLLLDVQAFNDVFPHPLTELEAQGVSFLQRVGAQETLLGLDEVREVAGLPCVRLRSHSLPNHQHLLKRGFDLLLLWWHCCCWRCGCGSWPVRRCCTARCAPARTACPSRWSSSAPCAATPSSTGPSCPQPAIRGWCAVSDGCAPRAATNCRSCGTCCAVRCPSSARGPSGPSSPPSSLARSPGTPAGRSCRPASPASHRCRGGTTPMRRTRWGTTCSTCPTGRRCSTSRSCCARCGSS